VHNKMQGQSTIEFALIAGFFISTMVLGFIFINQFYSKNILTKWAASYSRCLALEDLLCDQKTKTELEKYFGFKNIHLEGQLLHGIWHSKITARFLGIKSFSGEYDLGPSEYKRVGHE
jgi:hypothetical protein